MHFVGGKGPTNKNPDPLPAHLTEEELARRLKKRKLPAPRVVLPQKPQLKPTEAPTEAVKTKLELASCQPSPVCETSLRESNLTSNQVVALDDGETESRPNQVNKETQTVYDKYILGAKIESILLKNY